MKIVVQRVEESSVVVDEKVIGKISNGYMVLLGVKEGDTEKEADYLVSKLLGLRIFMDEQEKMNLSIQDVKGELLIVSQFTLYADCKKGNRPSFITAAKPEIAEMLYEYFVSECKKKISIVETGEFGAHMSVSLVNQGPVTIIIDTDQK